MQLCGERNVWFLQRLQRWLFYLSFFRITIKPCFFLRLHRIIIKIRWCWMFFGIRTVLTRTDRNSLQYDPNQTVRHNKIQDIHARETRTNQTQNPIFISVHLNKFSDSRYTGAQTFWSKNNPEGQLLAQSIQEQLTNGLHPEKQRTAKQAPDSVYLMKHLTCPAMIVECGFLSNREETERLKQDGYQKKLSVCVINGYLNYLEG